MHTITLHFSTCPVPTLFNFRTPRRMISHLSFHKIIFIHYFSFFLFFFQFCFLGKVGINAFDSAVCVANGVSFRFYLFLYIFVTSSTVFAFQFHFVIFIHHYIHLFLFSFSVRLIFFSFLSLFSFLCFFFLICFISLVFVFVSCAV